MVVKHVFPSGSRLHGPPYTNSEEDEFYKRIGGGPTTVARGAGDRPKPTSPKQRSRRTPALVLTSSFEGMQMSAFGTKRTSLSRPRMSVFGQSGHHIDVLL